MKLKYHCRLIDGDIELMDMERKRFLLKNLFLAKNFISINISVITLHTGIMLESSLYNYLFLKRVKKKHRTDGGSLQTLAFGQQTPIKY